MCRLWGSGGQVRVSQTAQLGDRLALELAHPLGGDAVLGADVGELVLATIDQAVARADDVRGTLVESAHEIERAAPAGVLVVQDIPLLVETGQASTFDVVLVVDVPEELQVERAVRDRGWTEEQARSRVAAQAARADRLAAATHVIDNSGTHEDLRQRVTEVFEGLVGTS